MERHKSLFLLQHHCITESDLLSETVSDRADVSSLPPAFV